jgi:hypothetical protein
MTLLANRPGYCPHPPKRSNSQANPDAPKAKIKHLVSVAALTKKSKK